MADIEKKLRAVFRANEDIFRLKPAFVRRKYGRPGKRLRLHPDDYYTGGMERGAIKVRYLSSVIYGGSDSSAPPDEGLSYVSLSDDPSDTILFRDAIEILGMDLIGKELWEQYRTFPMHAKFFDFDGPLFHHLHLDFEDAARVNKLGKPEGYFFPVQYNSYQGAFPYSFFGFNPDTTKEEVCRKIDAFTRGDNRITELSRAYRLQPETGWYTPPGVLHAPGSLLTYEPQWNSGVTSVFENVTCGEVNNRDLLVNDCPEEKKHDTDYIQDLLDWEKNIDPDYRKNNFRPKIPAEATEDYTESWIMYGNEYLSARQLIVHPGRSALVKDSAAYGCVLVQGYGTLGPYRCETPQMIRLGQLTAAEFFVSNMKAAKGVLIRNESFTEPLVILKHFGSDNTFYPGSVV